MDDPFWAAALGEAEAADTADPLAGLRARFRLPAGMIYLDGNSLGPAPEAALAALREAGEREWAERLIASWNDAGWFVLPERLGDLVAPLIGAAPGEVVVCDTTSINIFKALHAGMSLRPERHVIVAEAASFPTDLYIAEGVCASQPGTVLRLEGIDGTEVEGLIDADVAVVLVNQVDYRTGRRRDVPALTARAHAAGAVIVWDLCHSAGVMAVDLNAAGADLAVGCTYKYLNGGPGAPAFLYCAQRHQTAVRQPLSGWWGHEQPFLFERGFRPDPGIRKFLCGTQPILSLRAAEAGLAIAGEADLAAVRQKSLALTGRFMALVREIDGIGILTPDDDTRGSQVALVHPGGHAIVQALIARGVIGDFRAPDILRFGFAPLILRHVDVVRAARTLEQILLTGCWDQPKYQQRAAVT